MRILVLGLEPRLVLALGSGLGSVLSSGPVLPLTQVFSRLIVRDRAFTLERTTVRRRIASSSREKPTMSRVFSCFLSCGTAERLMTARPLA